MKKILLIALFMVIVVLPFSVQGWGPATHSYISNELLDNPEGNAVLMACAQNQECREAFLAGSEIPDITVVYYFEKGGEKYRATHNWNFQQNIMAQATNEREVAFAWGVAQHLISDTIAHQDVVPNAIASHGIPNWLLHPLLEQKYDSYIKETKPELVEQSAHMFDAIIYGQYGNRYVQMVENAIPAGTINVQEHVIKLAAAFGSFYNPEGGAYKPENVGIFGVYPFVTGIADWMSPVTSISGVDQINTALDKTLQQNRNIYNNWGARHALIPHGFDDLHNAEIEGGAWFFSVMFTIFIIAIFVVPIVAYIYFKKIIVIPIVLAIMVTSLITWFLFIYMTL